MSKVPELRDEINRKAFEAIEFLIAKVHAGAITPHQFGTGIDVLWMAVAGLINDDITDLITAGGNEAPIDPPIEKRAFIKARETITLDRVVGDDRMYVKSYFDGDMTNTKSVDCKSPVGARDMIIKTADKLLAAGYLEL
jgi:hypothetical protein